MTKVRPSITADSEVWRDYKKSVENASQDLEEYMRERSDFGDADVSDLLSRAKSLEDEAEALRDEAEQLKSKAEGKESEAERLRSRAERLKESRDKVKVAVEELTDLYREIQREKRRSRKDVDVVGLQGREAFDMWLKEVDLSADELEEKVIEEVDPDDG